MVHNHLLRVYIVYKLLHTVELEFTASHLYATHQHFDVKFESFAKLEEVYYIVNCWVE